MRYSNRRSSDRSINIIVLAGLWSSLCSDANSDDCYLDNRGLGKQALELGGHRNLHSSLLETIALLRSSGKRVFIVTDVPRFAIDPISIVRNSVMRSRGELATLLSSQIFSLDAVDEEDFLIKPADTITDSEVRRAASEGDAHIIDLARNLCPASRCRFLDNGVLLYADASHLTPAAPNMRSGGRIPNFTDKLTSDAKLQSCTRSGDRSSCLNITSSRVHD